MYREKERKRERERKGKEGQGDSLTLSLVFRRCDIPEKSEYSSWSFPFAQLIYDVITVANLGVEYFETETGQDLSDFYFCYPPLSSDVSTHS